MSNSVCYKIPLDNSINGTTGRKNNKPPAFSDPGQHARTVAATLATASEIVPVTVDPSGWHKTASYLFFNTGGLGSAFRSAKTVLLSGTLPPRPEPLLLSYKDKVKNPNYRRSRFTGEIVVSPYQVGKTLIDFNGSQPIIVDSGPCTLNASANLYGGPLQFERSSDYWVGDIRYQTNQYYACRHGSITGWRSALDYIDREWLEGRFTRMYPILESPDFVQDTIASANERDVDILTNLFELPETILSIGKTWKSVRSIIQNFINRKNLTDKERSAYLLRCRSAEQVIRKQIGKYSNLYVEATSKEDRLKAKQSLKYWTNKLRKFQLDKKLSLVAFADLISSAWLRLRYEILPIIFTCKGLAKTAESQWNTFQTTRNTLVEEYEAPIIDGFTFRGTSTVTWKCMVKYGYAAQSGRDLRKAFSVNAFLSLWELGKLTFVIDWFFSVGNFLSARFGRPSLAVRDGMTLSSKLKIQGDYVHNVTGVTFSVDAEHYNRVIVNPQEFSSIFFRINLNWMRYADAGALVFGELKRHFKLK